MQAGKQNLLINKKASFEFNFWVLNSYDKTKPPGDVAQNAVDLTGCTITAKVKAKITDTAALFTFTGSVPTPLRGHARLSQTAAQTASMSFDKGLWDVLITFPDGSVVKYLEGNITLDKTVS